MLSVLPEVLPVTFGALRRCGRGEEECVVYWLGSIDERDRVDEVLQPPHVATYGSYEVESPWVTDFFMMLRSQRRTVRAQVHTHPGAKVRHSPVDDAFAIAPSTGFVSIVIPYFATADMTLAGAHLTELSATGDWRERELSQVIAWT